MASWFRSSSNATPTNALASSARSLTQLSGTRKVHSHAAEDEDRQIVNSDSDANLKKIKALEYENRSLREALDKANHTTTPLCSSADGRELTAQELQSQAHRIIQQLSAELKATKAYLVQPDEYATADVLSMVEKLNSQIENTAASINDVYESSEKIQSYWDVHDNKEFYQTQRDLVKKHLGKAVYNANTQIDESLHYQDPVIPDSPLPLQAALQNILVKWSIQVTDRFGPSGQGAAATLNAVYDSIRTREEQAVVGRWRVMTLSSFDPRAGSYIDTLIPVFLALLLVCGTGKEDAAAIFVPLLRRKLTALEEMLFKLKAAMDFGVMSSDLELCNVESGEVYVPSTMKNAYDDGPGEERHVASDTVLCCVGLGLRAVISEQDKEARRLSSRLIRLPDVALVSLLT